MDGDAVPLIHQCDRSQLKGLRWGLAPHSSLKTDLPIPILFSVIMKLPKGPGRLFDDGFGTEFVEARDQIEHLLDVRNALMPLQEEHHIEALLVGNLSLSRR